MLDMYGKDYIKTISENYKKKTSDKVIMQKYDDMIDSLKQLDTDTDLTKFIQYLQDKRNMIAQKIGIKINA